MMVTVLLAGGFILIVSSSNDSRSGYWRGLIGVTVVLLGLLGCFAPLAYEFPLSAGSVIYAIKDDGSYTRHENGCWEWTEGNLHALYDEVGLQRSAPTTRLSPYDPELRYYKLRIRIADPARYLGYKGGVDRRRLAAERSVEDIKKVTEFWFNKVIEGRQEEIGRSLLLPNEQACHELIELFAPLNEHLSPEGLEFIGVSVW